ncbi:hypothetical protein WJX79_008968 [Trebouxia sp. C0005]
MKRKLPPALPWRPVTDLPPPGVFCTGEPLESYAFLPSATVSRTPAQASRAQKRLPSALAPAAAIHPTVSDYSSDDEAALPALPLGPAQHLSPPQDTEYLTHAVDPHGIALNCNDNVQERMAAVLGTRSPAERVALRNAAGPTLADLLNPNNVAYDPEFAARHRAMRAQADPLYAQQKARKQVTKLIKKLHWDKASAFTIEEHAYLLDLHDVHLEGKDAGKFESLQARMANEQQEYLKRLRSKAFTDRQRYTSCHPEAAHQIEAELAAQKKLVQRLPKLWQLAKLFSLQSIAQSKPGDPSMHHLATISRQGLPAVFSMPQPLTPIPLDQPCMPSLLTRQAAVSGPLPAFNSDHANLPPIAPTTTTAQTDRTPGLADVPLHQDAVCNSNPACQQADLLMTEGAFECLTGIWAPSYRLGWELPVTIRAKTSPHSGDSQTRLPAEQHAKQVSIDSPLPKRMLNLREKHELLYQHAVRKLGCDLWTRQQRARQAAQASMGDRPAAQQQPDHQQQQQAEEHMCAPYSPSKDAPVVAPYSPSTEPYIHDQHGMYNMPSSLTPTAADLPSAAMDAAPYPIQGSVDFLGGNDCMDADGSNIGADELGNRAKGTIASEAGIAYDSWQLIPYNLVIRAQLPAHLVHTPPPQLPGQPLPGPMPMRLRNKVAVVGVKMEYLEEWGFEMLLADELARWWAAILLHPQPNCELVVAKGLAPGQYLLTHQPGSDAVSCFTAQISATQDEPGGLGVPLPCGPLGVCKDMVYDLHAAHVNSGATDTEQDLFAGAWQQADPDIDQVPFTFPPVHGPSKMGRGQLAKRGNFQCRGAPRQNGGQAARGRGQGRGFIQHPAQLLPESAKPSKARHNYVPLQPAPRRGVSAADYASALDQGL